MSHQAKFNKYREIALFGSDSSKGGAEEEFRETIKFGHGYLRPGIKEVSGSCVDSYYYEPHYCSFRSLVRQWVNDLANNPGPYQERAKELRECRTTKGGFKF